MPRRSQQWRSWLHHVRRSRQRGPTATISLHAPRRKGDARSLLAVIAVVEFTGLERRFVGFGFGGLGGWLWGLAGARHDNVEGELWGDYFIDVVRLLHRVASRPDGLVFDGLAGFATGSKRRLNDCLGRFG